MTRTSLTVAAALLLVPFAGASPAGTSYGAFASGISATGYDVCTEGDRTVCARADFTVTNLRCGHASPTNYTCEISVNVALTTSGHSSCSFAAFNTTTEASTCVLFLGASTDYASGAKSYYNLPPTGRTVLEPTRVCIDYGTLTPECREVEVPIRLPGLVPGDTLP